MKLLDRTGGNTKVNKTNKQAGDDYHFAGLSMLPTNKLCPGAKAAGCMDSCLKGAGLAAVYGSVNAARLKKTELFLNDKPKFMAQLRRELTNYTKWCRKHNKQGVVRLNVLSDILWEAEGIPQEFPELEFYDYTKRADRFEVELPSNYKIMFSYSGKESYQKQVKRFLESGSDAPVAVVFRGKMPDKFLGRPVIDGDASDWINVQNKGVVVGLKAKGPAKSNDNGFVVDMNVIARG